MAGPIRQQELPGIGVRFDVDADDGQVTIVIHHSGRRELYVMPESEGSQAQGQRGPAVVSLDDDQARRLGAVLAGAYFQPALASRLDAIVGGLLIDWVTLGPGSRAAGRSIGEMEVRRRTRMSIVAIVRSEQTLIAPEPTEVLQAGDRLVVAGRPEDLDGLVRLVG